MRAVSFIWRKALVNYLIYWLARERWMFVNKQKMRRILKIHYTQSAIQIVIYIRDSLIDIKHKNIYLLTLE